MTFTEGVGIGIGRGKLVLCGEHAVVYGHPAILFAVDRGTEVRLTRRPGPTAIDSAHGDDRVREALCTVVAAEGLGIAVDTDLPVGRGMGSSAALAVALVRARASLEGETLDAATVYDRAMPVERAFHGNPSGMDVAVSAHGGCIWFERGAPPVCIPLSCGRWSVVVLDSGVAGDTKALVAGVGARRPAVDPALERIGALVGEARGLLHDADTLGPLLTENHALLREIGVSTPDLDRLVALALAKGAMGAKLAGAGGGGVVLALVREPEPLLAAAARAGVAAFASAPWP